MKHTVSDINLISSMYGSAVDEAAQPVATAVPGQGRAPDARHADGDATHIDVAAGLIHLTSLVQSIYARVSERHDLTPVQAKLLCVLLDGPRGMADLAHFFGVEKAALTGLMDRAERRGIAQRSPVPGDRRALQATLTDAGHRAAIAFHAEVNTELNSLIAPLTPHDRENFHSTMTKVIAECAAPPNGSAR
jgi:DNA-binding MarR family transcriptional regulator